MRGQMKTNGASIKNWPLTVGQTLLSSPLSLNSRSNQGALALKVRTDGFKQGLDFATVFPFFLYKHGLEMILYIPLILWNSI